MELLVDCQQRHKSYTRQIMRSGKYSYANALGVNGHVAGLTSAMDLLCGSLFTGIMSDRACQ